ncbi:UNVERIFIED_CONTAM: hypothetical protein K2H54_000141 [Gekko kuhli]
MLAAWPSEQAVATRVDDNGNELAIEQQVDEEALLAEAKPVAPPSRATSPSSLEQALKVSRKADSFVGQTGQTRTRHPANRWPRARSAPASGAPPSTPGMTEDQIMDLAAIFGWDIDFAQDLQAGRQLPGGLRREVSG